MGHTKMKDFFACFAIFVCLNDMKMYFMYNFMVFSLFFFSSKKIANDKIETNDVN